MRIATAEASRSRDSGLRALSGRFRRPDPYQQRHARLECLALVAVTLVILTGFWTIHRRQQATLDAASRDLGNGAIVRLATVDAATLAPVLDVFPSAAERQYAADAVTRYVHDQGSLTHVGALAAVTIPIEEFQHDRRLVTWRDRLARHPPQPGSRSMRLFTASDLATLKAKLVVRTPSQYSRRVLNAFALFFAAFWLAHLVRRMLGTTGDAILVPAIQLLSGLSLLAMMSLRDPLRDTDSAGGVAIGVALACLALVVVSSIDFENPRFRFATGLPLAAGVALAGMLLAFGSGPGESGVKVNLWGAQPIEAIRVLAVLALAAYFSRRWETVREMSERPASAPYLRWPRWADVSPLIAIVGTLLVFFFLQHDLGPALVLGCLALALYGVARGHGALVVTGLLVLVAGFAIGYELGIPATVAKRVAIWIDPWDNGLIGGDQVAHGLWALASGGVRGLGLGVGDGQVVPAGHTDLIVPVIGEELGLVGVAVIGAVYLLVIWRMLQIAARAPGDYTAFLALGCALSLAIPAIVIVGGVLGVLPLSGVVTPFLSFGKSSMICNVIVVSIVLAIARHSGPVRPHFARQLRTVGIVLAAIAVVLIADAARIEAVQADALAVRPTLVEQADGVARYQYNPRLLIAARRIPRGTIFDRNGLALATGSPEQATAMLDRLKAVGATAAACPEPPARCYPLRGRAFHLLGNWNDQTNWYASNVSFLEKDEAGVLQGYDDHAHTVERELRDGTREVVVTRDYRELLPLVRHKADPDNPRVLQIVSRSRDVTSSIDGVFQALVSRALETRIRAAGVQHGAVVVIDPDTGELLAAASVPYPEFDSDADVVPGGAVVPGFSGADTLLDRARYGLYPPGSTFKLITAAAALRSNAATSEFMCQRLDDGRIGTRIRGYTDPVRDDVTDREPHGNVDLHKGLVVSCNAYFAQLAVKIGPQAILDAAAPTGIKVANEPALKRLRGSLPYAGYGQGEVVATPLRMARVAGAIATDGIIRDTTALRVDPKKRSKANDVRWLTSEQASFLATSMRDVVQQGTGRVLAGQPIAIAGKTGTAELNDAPSHSWFVGFAPYATRGRRIAFAVIVENAGYGGRIAAPLAGDVVTAARTSGVIQ
ncbi:MAG TPA: FtsW/RodA/SpoVE family cell cycle protein [Vicinamibacterales bacterium]|nr:FtsW/RodA/SpoVE family cell cycle protein [Vicinamibacterales bacterium]